MARCIPEAETATAGYSSNHRVAALGIEFHIVLSIRNDVCLLKDDLAVISLEPCQPQIGNRDIVPNVTMLRVFRSHLQIARR